MKNSRACSVDNTTNYLGATYRTENLNSRKLKKKYQQNVESEVALLKILRMF